MQTVFTSQKGFLIIGMSQNLMGDEDLMRIRDFIIKAIKTGQTKIALSFYENSFLNGTLIGVMMVCSELVRQRNGTFAIIHSGDLIEPAKIILTALQIPVCASKNDLIELDSIEQSCKSAWQVKVIGFIRAGTHEERNSAC